MLKLSEFGERAHLHVKYRNGHTEVCFLEASDRILREKHTKDILVVDKYMNVAHRFTYEIMDGYYITRLWLDWKYGDMKVEDTKNPFTVMAYNVMKKQASMEAK